VKYVTREAGNLFRDSVEPRLDTDSDDRPWNRVQGSGITMADQPTASNGWRLELRHGRHDRQQATTSAARTAGRGRDEAQSLALTIRQRRPSEQLTPSHRPRLDSDACERRHVSPFTDNSGRLSVQQWHTLGRQCVSSPVRQLRLTLGLTESRPYTSSDSHSDNVVDDYWVTLVHPLSSASGAQFYLHCVSVTRPSHSLL